MVLPEPREQQETRVPLELRASPVQLVQMAQLEPPVLLEAPAQQARTVRLEPREQQETRVPLALQA
jgi:hypothetical protein